MTKKLSIVVIILFIIYIFMPKEKEVNIKKKSNEIRGVFISYIELNKYIKGKSELESKNNIDNMIKNIKENKFNTIYLQVRSHMDSIYNSKLFPTSKNIILNDNSNYDVLSYFLKKAHKYNIDIYAWINPYRIGITFDTNSNYYNRIKDNIKIVNNTYYLNPAKEETTKLIIDGIKEIIENYKIDGILFDDYFYPSNDIDIEEYKNINSSISIEDYHLNNINNMIHEVYKNIKRINKKVKFGVSPEGNIENNYSRSFADVKKWAKENDYVDFIMPQIYYGFNNETKPFNNVIVEWENILENDKVELYVALAFYKTGTHDIYAKSGEYEWMENSDIIKRQVLILRNHKRYKGFSLFRYDNLFDTNNTDITIKEFSNLKEIM